MILGLSDLENQLNIVVFSSVEVTMVTVIFAYGNQEVNASSLMSIIDLID